MNSSEKQGHLFCPIWSRKNDYLRHCSPQYKAIPAEIIPKEAFLSSTDNLCGWSTSADTRISDLSDFILHSDCKKLTMGLVFDARKLFSTPKEIQIANWWSRIDKRRIDPSWRFFGGKVRKVFQNDSRDWNQRSWASRDQTWVNATLKTMLWMGNNAVRWWLRDSLVPLYPPHQ